MIKKLFSERNQIFSNPKQCRSKEQNGVEINEFMCHVTIRREIFLASLCTTRDTFFTGVNGHVVFILHAARLFQLMETLFNVSFDLQPSIFLIVKYFPDVSSQEIFYTPISLQISGTAQAARSVRILLLQRAFAFYQLVCSDCFPEKDFKHENKLLLTQRHRANRV